MKKLKMPENAKRLMGWLSRGRITRWYELLEIPYSKKSSTDYLLDNLYHTLHTYDRFSVSSKPVSPQLDGEDLKWIKSFFGVDLVYDEGPLYILKEEGTVSE